MCPPCPVLTQLVPSGVAGTHLPVLEGLSNGVQPRDVVLVHAGDVAGVLEPGSVAYQQLFADRPASAPSHHLFPVPPAAQASPLTFL